MGMTANAKPGIGGAVIAAFMETTAKISTVVKSTDPLAIAVKPRTIESRKTAPFGRYYNFSRSAIVMQKVLAL